MRTAPGVFFLRELANKNNTHGISLGEYFAPPRRKELDYDWILAYSGEIGEILRSDGVSVPIDALVDRMRVGKYRYAPLRAVVANRNLCAVHSFVIVHQAERVLSFRTGKYYPHTDPLFGSRSIGIGGAVYPKDMDMLYNSLFGIISNGINELSYGIGLPRKLAERARYSNEVKPWMGVFRRHAQRHPNVLHVVMGYRCPDSFTPTKAALSVNDLRWINANFNGNDISDYDDTSRFLFSGDYVREFLRLRS